MTILIIFLLMSNLTYLLIIYGNMVSINGTSSISEEDTLLQNGMVKYVIFLELTIFQFKSISLITHIIIIFISGRNTSLGGFCIIVLMALNYPCRLT